jgi:hypothetical protein
MCGKDSYKFLFASYVSERDPKFCTIVSATKCPKVPWPSATTNKFLYKIPNFVLISSLS